MSTPLQFDFTVDKPSKTVTIVREFDAPLALVWDAFTTAEILDQWVAPKPWTSKTKSMDFREGGLREYAMVSPEGNERWAIQRYITVEPKTHFKLFNAFADANGNPEPEGSEWDYTFSEQNNRTIVRIVIYNESLSRMEKMIEMGFELGFTASIANLENLLSSYTQK